jgi:hypothetical protein
MNNKIEKSCPFCGEEGTEKYSGYISVVHKKDCLLYGATDCNALTTYDTELWQSRPIEDAFYKQLDECEDRNSSLWNATQNQQVVINNLHKRLEKAMEAIDLLISLTAVECEADADLWNEAQVLIKEIDNETIL